MKIDHNLNLAIPIYADDGKTVTAHVFSMPIGREVFERYYIVIAKAYSKVVDVDSIGAGMQIAALALRDVAKTMGLWEGPEGVEIGLMREIERLTNVLAPGPGGWETVTFHEAKAKGLIGEEDAAEVESAIVFFTLGSRMIGKTARLPVLERAALSISARLESSDLSAFRASLQKSTEIDLSARKAGSSVPS